MSDAGKITVTITKEEADRAVVAAVAALNNEAFQGLIFGYIWSFSKTAGGYRDKEGILRLRNAIETRLAVEQEAQK